MLIAAVVLAAWAVVGNQAQEVRILNRPHNVSGGPKFGRAHALISAINLEHNNRGTRTISKKVKTKLTSTLMRGMFSGYKDKEQKIRAEEKLAQTLRVEEAKLNSIASSEDAMRDGIHVPNQANCTYLLSICIRDGQDGSLWYFIVPLVLLSSFAVASVATNSAMGMGIDSIFGLPCTAPGWAGFGFDDEDGYSYGEAKRARSQLSYDSDAEDYPLASPTRSRRAKTFKEKKRRSKKNHRTPPQDSMATATTPAAPAPAGDSMLAEIEL